MKRYCYTLIVSLSVMLSCGREPSFDPWAVNQVLSGEVNGVPFETGMTVRYGASLVTDMCDKDVIAMSLVRKVQENEFAIVHLNFFHIQSGNYVLTDTAINHRNRLVCTLDSITASLSFESFPGNDESLDVYRLLEGPWNYLRVLYYDYKKNEIQGQFAAKFVRINKRQHATEAVDTITYTNAKFLLSNVHVQEVFTEPR